MAGHSTIKSIAEIAEEIARFVVVAGCVREDETGFSHSVDLFDAGYLDSLGVVRLIAFIEERYAIELGAAELTDQRFTTVDGMAEVLVGMLDMRFPGLTDEARRNGARCDEMPGNGVRPAWRRG